MPLMNANKLKWLKKETKTYAPQKHTQEKDIVCTGHIRCATEKEMVKPTLLQQTVKSRKTQARKSNRIKYLNKHSLLVTEAFA